MSDRAVDLLVLGGGVAGLSAALHGAVAGLDVVLLTKGELGHSATRYAQGGVAAALDPGDSPELHLSDTLAAGGGLCDADAARILVTEGPGRVRDLMAAGAVFDRTGSAEAAALALAREGGHSTARVVHAGGDATGAEIERALVAALEPTGVDLREHWFVLDVLRDGAGAAGVLALDPDGNAAEVRARHTLLASGGAGQLYSVTTNPPASTGDGVAMALRHGIPVADVEFVQFHPTALHHASMPRPLLSEALRGDGAVLRDTDGVAFMAGEHPLADLAPRDVVARAVATRIVSQGVDHLWLDATGIPDFERRFPTIWRACQSVGLDPRTDWLPVAPAAHYTSGGVVVDLDGATALPGLWAVGEVACSGVHGANRLASNSLLEGLVFAPRAVAAVTGGLRGPRPTGAMRGVEADVPDQARLATGAGDAASGVDAGALRARLQAAMTLGAGVVRSGEDLEAARGEVDQVAAAVAGQPASQAEGEVANLAEVGLALVRAALARRESRGSHARAEFPAPSADFAGRFVHVGGDVGFVPLPVPAEAEARVP
jgi:L-aspartate oxidase